MSFEISDEVELMITIRLADMDAFQLDKVAATDSEFLVYRQSFDDIAFLEMHVAEAGLLRQELHVFGALDLLLLTRISISLHILPEDN